MDPAWEGRILSIARFVEHMRECVVFGQACIEAGWAGTVLY